MSERKISRRDFLKTAAAGAAAAGMAGVTSRAFLRDMFPPAKAQEPIPINSAVVIGSGLAGLTAAMLLTDMGKEVTVLESCHRPGGRCQQINYPNGQHSTVAFMEWYGRDIDPNVWWLVDELGLQSDYHTWPDPTFFHWRGEYHFNHQWTQLINSLPWDDPEGADDYFEMMDEVWTIGSMEEPFEVGNYPQYDYTDFKDWILETPQGKPHHRTDVNEFAGLCMRSELGSPNDTQSAAIGLDCLYYWDNSSCYALKDGNYQFIEELMTRIQPSAVHLNEEVGSVENTANGVKVRSKGGSYTADVAIVAVPHTVVSGIVSELPSERVAALETMGSMKNIVAVQQFSEKYWDTVHGFDGWGGYTDVETTGRSYCIDNETYAQHAQPEGIISEYINEPSASNMWPNPKGIHVKGGSARQITNHVLDNMEMYWPGATDYVIDGSERVYCWEPYIAMFKPRYVLDGTYVLNRQPVNRIFFAGDYVYGAGVTSAIASARDAVANLT